MAVSHGVFGRKKRRYYDRPSRQGLAISWKNSLIFDTSPPSSPYSTSCLPRHITENRAQMNQGGVLIVSFLIDERTKSLLRAVHIESRWFLLPNEVRFAHANLQKAARSSYETTMKDIPDIEEKDLLRIIKQDLERTSQQLLKKTPLIIPLFHIL